jgi:hypothetical protein
MSTQSIDDLLAELPIDQIAGRLGIAPDEAQRAVTGALPAILGGLKANADDPSGERSLAGALTQHSPALVEGGIDIDQVDTADGEKIVDNVFGPNKDQVVVKVSDSAGTDPSILQKIMPVLAPLVLSFLSKQLMGQGGATSGTTPGSSPAGPPDMEKLIALAAQYHIEILGPLPE